MKLINFGLFATALLLAGNATAQDANVTTLTKKLAPWAPVKITNAAHKITVTLPGASLPPEAYNAVIASGVCSPIWTKDVPATFLSGIKELSVVNKYQTLGYTFEDPLSTCRDMGSLMDQPAKALMLSKTHLYRAK